MTINPNTPAMTVMAGAGDIDISLMSVDTHNRTKRVEGFFK
ncbi:MAG: hypothetical protein SVY15_07535 [Halobacteriota archaeon]|nr:hypothetical protein [Halobacteriota archaeon]